MSRRSLWLALLTAALLAALAAWFLRHFERVEIHIPATEDRAVRRDPWLFAREALGELGLTLREAPLARLLRHPPPAGDVIVLDTDRPRQPDEARRLLAWAAAGGHLILRPPEPSREEDAAPPDDPLLDLLGLRVRFDPNITWPDEPAVWRVGGRALRLLFNAYYVLEGTAPADLLVVDENGVHMIQRRHGRGLVTVLSDMQLWHNGDLADFAHADALWHLLTQRGRPGTVWLVTAHGMPPLWRLVWDGGRLALAALAVLLLAAGWRAAPRFGPLLPDAPPPRRALLEHIDAAGHWAWRQDQREALLAAERRAVLAAVARRHRQSPPADDPARRAWLAARLGLDAATVERLFFAPAPRDPRAFTDHIRQLENLRNPS